jgi:uncharacterized phage infection (PIP) family protein YhgE
MSIPAEIKTTAMAIVTYFSLKLFGAPEWGAIVGCIVIGEFLLHDERTRAGLEDTATRLQTIVTNVREIKAELERSAADFDDIKDKLEDLVNQVQTLADRSEGVEVEVGRITQLQEKAEAIARYEQAVQEEQAAQAKLAELLERLKPTETELEEGERRAQEILSDPATRDISIPIPHTQKFLAELLLNNVDTDDKKTSNK